MKEGIPAISLPMGRREDGGNALFIRKPGRKPAGSDAAGSRNRVISALYVKEYAGLMRYVTRRLRDQMAAEDIVQETFLEALCKWELLHLHPNPTGWLYMTARNKLLKYGSRRQRIAVTELADGQRPTKRGVSDWRSQAELRCLLEELLGEEDRRLLYLHYRCGYTVLEMADLTGLSEGKLKDRQKRILHRLREADKRETGRGMR